MTVLVTGDLHLNAKPRDAYRHDFQKLLRSTVRQHRVGCVIILGDLTDEKDYHPAKLVNQVVDHLYRLSLMCPVVVQKGNHDYTSIDEIPFFDFVRRVHDVSWVGAPTQTPISKNPPAALARLGKVLWLPHTPDYKRDWEGIDMKGWDFIFAHNTFEGAAGESGRKLSGIPTEVFPQGSTVVSGDIHTPQAFGPITYCGSPYTVDFGEGFEPRMLLIKDDGEIKSIRSPGPQKRLVELGSKKDDLPVIHDFRAREGDTVQIRVHLGPGEYAQWAEIKQEVQNWAEKERGYVVHLIKPEVSKAAVRMTKRRAKPDIKSDTELVEAYGKLRKLDEASLKVGKKLL